MSQMTREEWNKKRMDCSRPTNRELVEHAIEELYAHMKWPKLEYIIHAQSRLDASHRSQFSKASYWHYNSRTGKYYDSSLTNDRLEQLAKKLIPLGPKSIDSTTLLDPYHNVLGLQNRHHRILYDLRPYELKPASASFDLTVYKLLLTLLTECVGVVLAKQRPLVLEKPYEIHLNAAGQLHNEHGPSIHWRNGDRQYHIDGVEVPYRFIAKPPTLDYINRQPNQERRRILLERYGYDKWLKGMRAKLRSEDEYGKLWVVPNYTSVRNRNGWGIQREDLVMVELQNSTAEPDGTYKKYFLRVPPTVQTPKEAVAWTFRADAYKPKVMS